MTIDIEGLSARSRSRAFVERRIHAAFDGLRAQPVGVRVGFTDDNGPKGGNAIRCGINVDLPRCAPIHIEHRAATEGRAFAAALLALDKRLDRERGRRRAVRRRPKKYYLAKRLLMPDEFLSTLPAAPRKSA